MAGIYRLSSGGLLVNDCCQARCSHCLYLCAPEREAGYLKPEDAVQIFRRLLALGCPSLHISGGEPFLDLNALLDVVAAAREARMPIDYVETSASWVKEEASARAAFARLRAAGISSVTVAISPYHNEFISMDQVFLALNACREEGVNAYPWLDEFFPDLTALPTGQPHSRQEYEAYFGSGYWGQLPKRFGLTMGGRALITHRKTMPVVPASRIPHMCRSCAELNGRSHFHIDRQGFYIPPGCLGLALPLDALGRDLDPERFPLYTRLAAGPKFLLDYCKSLGFAPEASYYNRCHLCRDMRLFLYRRSPGRYEELHPADYYRQLEEELKQPMPKP